MVDLLMRIKSSNLLCVIFGANNVKEYLIFKPLRRINKFSTKNNPLYNTLTQQIINELRYLSVFSSYQILPLAVSAQFGVRDSEIIYKALLCSY